MWETVELHVYLKRIGLSLCWCVYGSLSYNADFGLCALLIALCSCQEGLSVQADDEERSFGGTEWERKPCPSWGF